MTSLSAIIMAVRAGVLFVLLAGVSVHAQAGTGQGSGRNTGAAYGPLVDPGTAAPASLPAKSRPDQGAPDKVQPELALPNGTRPDRGSAEPDAARFGGTGSRLEATAAELCAALSPGAALPPAWQRSALPDESWECFAERSFAPAGGGGSVFAILRGRTEAGVEGLRLKLNLPGDGAGQEAQDAAREILQAVFAALGRGLPPVLRPGLAERAPFSQHIGGMALDLRQEFGTVPRYNLMVDFAPSRQAPRRPRAGGETGRPDQP